MCCLVGCFSLLWRVFCNVCSGGVVRCGAVWCVAVRRRPYRYIERTRKLRSLHVMCRQYFLVSVLPTTPRSARGCERRRRQDYIDCTQTSEQPAVAVLRLVRFSFGPFRLLSFLAPPVCCSLLLRDSATHPPLSRRGAFVLIFDVCVDEMKFYHFSLVSGLAVVHKFKQTWRGARSKVWLSLVQCNK